jgi:integration host factor subunit alpha
LSLRKKDIVNNINSKAHLSLNDSSLILEEFLNLIKKRKESIIKISGFGRFFLHTSPKRIGRNPKTAEKYLIPPRTKLIFKASEKLKKSLN